MMKCTVGTDRPSVCKKYPHLEQKRYFKQNTVYSPYYFESCQYVEDSKLVESKLLTGRTRKILYGLWIVLFFIIKN